MNTQIKTIKDSFKDNEFDAIIDVVSMQHLDLQHHRLAYRAAYRCLNKGGQFFQWHLGERSAMFLEVGADKIDEITLNNINNPSYPLFNNGPTAFLSITRAQELLEGAGFKEIKTESHTRTYNLTMQVEYLSITAKKL